MTGREPVDGPYFEFPCLGAFVSCVSSIHSSDRVRCVLSNSSARKTTCSYVICPRLPPRCLSKPRAFSFWSECWLPVHPWRMRSSLTAELLARRSTQIGCRSWPRVSRLRCSAPQTARTGRYCARARVSTFVLIFLPRSLGRFSCGAGPRGGPAPVYGLLTYTRRYTHYTACSRCTHAKRPSPNAQQPTRRGPGGGSLRQVS